MVCRVVDGACRVRLLRDKELFFDASVQQHLPTRIKVMELAEDTGEDVLLKISHGMDIFCS